MGTNRSRLWMAFTGLAVTAAAVALWLVFGPSPDGSNSGTLRVRIGAVLPLTGPAGDIGEKARQGLEVAKALHPIDVVYEDSASNPKTAISAFRKLTAGLGSPPVGVISVMSSAGNAIIPLAEDEQVINVHIASAPGMAAGKTYAFRWYITSDDQMGHLVRYLEIKGMLGKQVAFIHTNDDYGDGSLKAFTAHLRRVAPATRVVSEAYDPKARDFRPMLAKVKSEAPEVVAVVGFSTNLGILVQQLREQMLSVPLVGDDAISYPEILAAAGKAADGVVFAGLPIEALETQDPFGAKFRELYQKEPNDFAVFSYGIATMLHRCATRHQGENARVLARCLETETFSTPLGKIKFDAEHSGNVPLVYKVIRGGQVVVLPNP